MARKPAAAAASESTAVANWDEELAKAAQTAAAMEEGVGGGQFFSVKAGTLSFNGAQLPNNQMAVIVLDAIMERVYYEGDYDPEVIMPPTCFAFGREEDGMKPHEKVFEAGQEQNDVCKGCQWDAWGSADRGKGKACRQVRRLALISAGSWDAKGVFTAIEDASHFEKASIGFLKVPVTSVKAYAGYVKQVAATLRKPPFAMITMVKVRPDPKTQLAVEFSALEEVPPELFPALMKRVKEANGVIDFPYDLTREEAPAKPAARGKPGGKAPAKRGGKY